MAADSFYNSDRRRLAAIAFLSNISLDGTYRDTNIADIVKYDVTKDDAEKPDGADTCSSSIDVSQRERGVCKRDTGTGISPGNKTHMCKSYDHRADIHGRDYYIYHPYSKKWRTSSVSSEREGFRQSFLPQFRDDTSARRSSNFSSESRDPVTTKMGSLKFVNPEQLRQTKNDRLLIVSKMNRVPLLVYSFLRSKHRLAEKPRVAELETTRIKHFSGSTGSGMSVGLQAIQLDDGQDVSYEEFLSATNLRNYMRMTSLINQAKRDLVPPAVIRSLSHDPKTSTLSFTSTVAGLHYNPDILDGPDFHTGSYRTTLTFPSYLVSVIDYVKASDLKRELNEKFHEHFPNIQLTLSKLRSLKNVMKNIAYTKCDFDLWMVAHSYVFFEKLVIKNLVNKNNRKACVAACLLLSAKVNDIKRAEVTLLMETCEEQLKIHRRDLLSFEVAVWVALEFALQANDSDVNAHLQRINHPTR